MANKWTVLSERDRYSNKRRNLDNINYELNKLINLADTAFDGEVDDALISMLNMCKNNINNLQRTITTLETQLYNLAYRLEAEQKR